MPNTREFLLLNRLLTEVIEEQVGGPVPLPVRIEATVRNADEKAPIDQEHERWLALLDLCATPQVLRTGIQKRGPAVDELLALVRYLATKPVHSEADRDRGDWLMTHILKLETREGGGVGSIQARIQALVGDLPAPKLSESAENLLSELAAVLEDITDFRSFQQLTSSGLIARGREIKQEFKEEFFHPQVLSAVVNYNLMFGKKFDRLFGEAATRAREFASGLAEKDYRSTAEDFRKLAAPGEPPVQARPGLAPAALASATARPAPPAPALTPLEQMKALGIDIIQEESKLRLNIQNLAAFVRAAGNKTVTSIPLPHSTLAISDWEARAFAMEYPASDRSFRADFNRYLRQSVGFIARMYEELTLYYEKRGTEYLWKPHYDSLIWLLYEGRQYLGQLTDFVEETRTRGLSEKAEQLAQTAAKLDANLNKVAEIF